MKLPEPYTFFVDRSLGRMIVVEALRAAGECAIAHDDIFHHKTTDREWLEIAGMFGVVVLTKDKNVRRNELERRAIVEARVACFMLGRGDLSGPTMGSIFVAALPRIRKTLRRFQLPLAACVTAGAEVRVLLENGRVLTAPKDVR